MLSTKFSEKIFKFANWVRANDVLDFSKYFGYLFGTTLVPKFFRKNIIISKFRSFPIQKKRFWVKNLIGIKSYTRLKFREFFYLFFNILRNTCNYLYLCLGLTSEQRSVFNIGLKMVEDRTTVGVRPVHLFSLILGNRRKYCQCWNVPFVWKQWLGQFISVCSWINFTLPSRRREVLVFKGWRGVILIEDYSSYFRSRVGQGRGIFLEVPWPSKFG
jgi:hypothetical protein